MKKKGCKDLTWTKRVQIETMLQDKIPKTEIARRLGICVTTVYNEIRRGEYMHRYSRKNEYDEITYYYKPRYSARIAQDKYEMNMTAKGCPIKLGHDYGLVRYIEDRVLSGNISPCAALGEMKRLQLPYTNISKTTLYRYIRLGFFGRLSMKKKNRSNEYVHVAKRAPRGVSIEMRPKEVSDRSTFGHWEMDLICGPTKGAILAFTERLTRKEILFLLRNKKAETVVSCVDQLEMQFGSDFPRIFKTITVDNGPEFSDFRGIQTSIHGGPRTSVYYCHPYSAYERGSNERLNREVRRLIPKKTDLLGLSEKFIREVEDWVNNYPREVLGYHSSADLFSAELRNIAV